jgi:hydroxymethylpyrimidine/phosphomethylpyrimidine kinase
MAERPVVLLVGGTDPSAGAGLAADIRTVSSLGVHPTIAVTAVTVQTSGRVWSWNPMKPSLVAEQIRAVCNDGPVHAVKTGMLASPEIARTVAEMLDALLPDIPLICDPVLRAGSGDSLGAAGMVEVLVRELLPGSFLCTPNISEASVLSGLTVSTRTDMEEAGRAIRRMGAGSVLVKGGHLEDNPDDVLVTTEGTVWFRGERVTDEDVHGTGCTLASAIAALTASGFGIEDAISSARVLLIRGMRRRWRRKDGLLLAHDPPPGPAPGSGDDTAFYFSPAFCSRCGGELSGRTTGERHLGCACCSAIHYRNPLPAVTLLVHDGKKLLLVRRARPPEKGMLCLPGGFMELGETVEECGSRELFEETGLRADPGRLMGIETDMTAYGGVVLAALDVTSWSGDPVPGDDASEVLWVSLDAVPGLAFDSHDRLVAELCRRLDSSSS